VAEPVTRLVNLAFFLANSRGPVERERIRTEVEGYGESQSVEAFLRMFERDKDELRRAGFQIGSDEEGRYWIDRGRTFARAVDLTAEEAATLRAVALALLDDPSFPYAEELRVALAKVSTAVGTSESPVVARTADESPEAQGALVAQLDQAVRARKRASFSYTNSRGENKAHDVEPLGLFARDGRWYLVAGDTALGEVRVYAVLRMADLALNTARPKSADFERPADFDVSRFIGLPFQYGTDAFSATLVFSPASAWRAAAVTQSTGSLTRLPDGSAEWVVPVRDERRLLRWVVENGPGIAVSDPPELAEKLGAGLAEAEVLHG